MRKLVLITALVVGVFALAASTAFAGNPHFTKNSSITCAFSTSSGGITNDTVTCTGTGGIAGLGNANVKFVLSSTGEASYFCKNPGNGNESPGQNKVPATIPPTSVEVDKAEVKNGRLAFFGPDGNTLTQTATAVSATGKAAGCSNESWTTRVAAIFYTSITVSIQQPPGNEIIACTKSDPNGLAPGPVTLTCN